jgi:hypothetical protein
MAGVRLGVIMNAVDRSYFRQPDEFDNYLDGEEVKDFCKILLQEDVQIFETAIV